MKTFVGTLVGLLLISCTRSSETTKTVMRMGLKPSTLTTRDLSFLVDPDFTRTGTRCALDDSPHRCYCKKFPSDPVCAQAYCNTENPDPKCNQDKYCANPDNDPASLYFCGTSLNDSCGAYPELQICQKFHDCDGLLDTGTSFICSAHLFCPNHLDDPRCTKVFGYGPNLTSEGFNAYLKPNDINEINCFAIAIGGTGMSSSTCGSQFDTSRSILEAGMLFSGFASGADSSSEISIEVPYGNRAFYLIGFNAEAGACPLFQPSTNFDKTHLSDPYLIGQTSAFLKTGEAAITMNASLDADTSILRSCKGPLFSTQEGSHAKPTH